MGVMIELTTDQELAVLASYGYSDAARDPAAPPPRDDLVVTEQPFDEFYGIAFGTPHNGKNQDLPPAVNTADGLVSWRFYIGGELAANAGVSDHGGDFHVHTVADELAKWQGGGHDSILVKIDEMGLDDDDFAVFPENIGQVPLYGVAYDGRDWRLEVWQQGELRHAITGPGLAPGEQFKFTLYQSGSKLGIQYYWK
jgi:hypothetical protein